jgi:RimJ/RimL family protein N-acetyltransferase
MYEQADPPLEGRLVRLRAYERIDADTLNELFSDPDVLRGIGSVRFPQPVAGFNEFLDGVRGSTTTAAFAIETLSGRSPVGGCGLEDIEPAVRAATLGIWIGKPYWGRGFGTDATRTLCRFGFRYMNLHRIELNVFAWNASAVRAYEKVGFRVEGTRRRSVFHGGLHTDSYLMGILDEELIDA